MRLLLGLSFIIFFTSQVFSQQVDDLDSMSIPPEPAKVHSSQKSGAELSLPVSTTSAGVVKSNTNDKQNDKNNVGAILDFEGEVIEGERRRPDLFLQISIDNIKFDSLMYNRDDFNDYLEVDRKSRTRFLKMK